MIVITVCMFDVYPLYLHFLKFITHVRCLGIQIPSRVSRPKKNISILSRTMGRILGTLLSTESPFIISPRRAPYVDIPTTELIIIFKIIYQNPPVLFVQPTKLSTFHPLWFGDYELREYLRGSRGKFVHHFFALQLLI